MRLGERIGIFSGRKTHNLNVHFFRQKQPDTTQRRLYAGGIGIVDKGDIVGKATHSPYLPFGERSTRRSHHVLHPRLVHRYNIQISLHHDAFVGLAYRILSLIETIQLLVLVVDFAFWRIHIFGHLLVGTHCACAKAHHTPGDTVDWKYHTAAVAVVIRSLPSSVALSGQSGMHKHIHRKACRDCGINKGSGAVDGISQMKTGNHGIAYPPVAEICQSYTPTLGGIMQISLECLYGKLIERE